jgi:hypothetical protein
VSWYAGKTAIVRDAIGQYLAQPIYPLNCVTPKSDKLQKSNLPVYRFWNNRDNYLCAASNARLKHSLEPGTAVLAVKSSSPGAQLAIL